MIQDSKKENRHQDVANLSELNSKRNGLEIQREKKSVFFSSSRQVDNLIVNNKTTILKIYSKGQFEDINYQLRLLLPLDICALRFVFLRLLFLSFWTPFSMFIVYSIIVYSKSKSPTKKRIEK